MRATVMHKAGNVRIENIPDATLIYSTDALIRITRACICGNDLWPFNDLVPEAGGRRMGHEAIGVVEAIGSDMHRIRAGDLVIMPSAYADGKYMFCDEGLPTSCVHDGFFGTGGAADVVQAEALRVPQADGTLYPIHVAPDHSLMPSLLTLSDVMGTGHHAAVQLGSRAELGSP